MKILTVETLTELIHRHGFNEYLTDLMEVLRQDFGRWQEFTMMPRPAMFVPGGVLELMPVCDDTYYSYKYVNCHPANPRLGLQTVVATGQLVRVDTGYPVMISEMTLLTAMRTAATTAMATDLMSRPDSRVLALIGTGAQSEFQVAATRLVRDITTVRFFDTDPAAMDKFERNLAGSGVELIRAGSAELAVRGADIVTVCTACREHVDVVMSDWIRPGIHINGLGGDSHGKTELERPLLDRCSIVVEYLDQSLIEGEIQRFTPAEARKKVQAELHEVVTGKKAGRSSRSEITLYDSVGIGLEDFSALKLSYKLANRYELGEELALTPVLSDPKDLVSLLSVYSQASPR